MGCGQNQVHTGACCPHPIFLLPLHQPNGHQFSASGNRVGRSWRQRVGNGQNGHRGLVVDVVEAAVVVDTKGARRWAGEEADDHVEVLLLTNTVVG